MGGRYVAQLAVVTGNAELFHQPKRRKRIRLVEQKFGEHLFVKQIQTPWPEPDEIDQEDGKRHQHDRDRGEKPLQNTHGRRPSAQASLVNSKFLLAANHWAPITQISSSA